jgi:hypothetical protein
MPVNFANSAHILAVHGVQVGTGEDITSTAKIDKLVKKALARSHIERDYKTLRFYYEDINDAAQRYHQFIAKAISLGKPLVGKALKSVIDLAGDVVTASAMPIPAPRKRFAADCARKLWNPMRRAIRCGWFPIAWALSTHSRRL